MKFIKKYSYVLCVIVLILSCIFAVVGIGTAILKDNAKKNVITAEITETREVVESTTTSTVSETTTTTVTTKASTSTLASTSTSCTETTVAETIPTVATTVEMPITIAETVVDTTYTETVEVSTEAEPVEIYYVYKPSTRYVHVNTCKWFTSDCRRVEDESDIGESARLCDECNPDFKITDTYKPSCSLSDYDIRLLQELIANEYGGIDSKIGYSNGVIERAKIVAATMNRCNKSGWSVQKFVDIACAPWGFVQGKDYYNGVAVADMRDAVDYYFENGEYGFYNTGYWQSNSDSWYGDGTYNHFYNAG